MTATSKPPKHPKAGVYLRCKLFDGISKFTELEHRIAELPTNQERGDAFEVFAEAYLSTQRLYQTKTVWPISMLPMTIRDRYALGQSDVGVDGMFETHLGEFHAYQAKFRTGRPALTWEELSTFIGLTDRIAERLVFTNCNELSAVVTDRRGFYAIRGTDLDRLQAEDFEVMHSWLSGAVLERKCKSPVPRQQEALDAILNTLKNENRATIVMPCGTGKTLVALWAAEQLESKSVLVLVPSLALVSQTLRTWLKETCWMNASFLCVCSDPTVTSDTDSLVLHQADVDFPVTTDSKTVQTFLERATDWVKVVFSTYQSARVVAAGMGRLGRFDIGIFDEAHKTAGREGALFSFALHDTNLPIAKRLFMTATPRHYKVRQGENGRETRLAYSMDVPELYGPTAYRLSFAQAVKENMICDYRVLISVITTEMVNEEMLRNGEVMVAGNAIKARQVANQLAVKDVLDKYKVGKVITFHKSVSAAASFTAVGPEGIGSHVPGLAAFHVNGDMSASKREPILRSFADGDRTLISNARCLTEGVDVPAVDMVAFLSPKRSRIDIVQATGRAMRRNDATQKTHGYVLLPLFLEERAGESLDAAIARADFDEIWAVLQALQEHDEVLGETIAQIKEGRDVARGFDDQTFREKVEIVSSQISLDTLRQSITTRLLDALISVRSSWESMFQALVRFKQQHNHCNVQWDHDLDLAFWVIVQRESKQRRTLSIDKIRRLEAIGIEWEPRDERWEAMFELLVQFKQQHGHCIVLHKGAKDRQLAWWCKKQRQRRQRLYANQVQRLDQIGFVWDFWEAMFLTLVQFKQQYGHCNVLRNSSTYPMLGSWLVKQRLDKQQGILSEDQVRRLTEIGLNWDKPGSDNSPSSNNSPSESSRSVPSPVVPREVDWDAMYHKAVTVRSNLEWQNMLDALALFAQQHGHCNVPRIYRGNQELAKWAERQRAVYELGGLSQERQQQLEALGFKWSLKNKKPSP